MKINKLSKSNILESVKTFKKTSLKEAKEKEVKTETGVNLQRQEVEPENKDTTPVIDHHLDRALKQSEKVKEIIKGLMDEKEKASKDFAEEQKKKRTAQGSKVKELKVDKKTGLIKESIQKLYKNANIQEGLFCTIDLKNRAELGKLVETLKPYNIKAHISRSMTEGYRYKASFRLTEDMVELSDPTGEQPAVMIDTDKMPEVQADVQPEVNGIPEKVIENSLVSLINAAIIDEFEAIEKYNSTINTLEMDQDLKNQDILDILHSIVDEENVHVGELQHCLDLVSNNNGKIKEGEQEASQKSTTEVPVESGEIK